MGMLMSTLTENCFRPVDTCPWCGGKINEVLYVNDYSAEILECGDCGFVYSNKILNKKGLSEYWKEYASQVHLADSVSVQRREQMYELEFDYIARIMDFNGKNVLDVGCGEGGFLNKFKKAGAICYGVEYGQEAAELASEKFKIWQGEFPYLDIPKNFDLIVFRGSLQYCIPPKEYLAKATSLLKPNGLLYITSSPNTQSLCFKLFKQNFTLPVGVTDYYGFSESLLTNYLETLNLKLIAQYHFYKESPYADVENDILKVAKAIECRRQGKQVDFKAPAFYDNMLTVVYKK